MSRINDEATPGPGRPPRDPPAPASEDEAAVDHDYGFADNRPATPQPPASPAPPHGGEVGRGDSSEEYLHSWDSPDGRRGNDARAARRGPQPESD